MEKTSFIMYSMWGEQIEKLSDSQAGKLIKAIFEYAKFGDKPSFDDLALDILFSIICNQLDIDGAKWEDVREKRSQAVRKRWDKRRSESVQNDTNEYKRIQNDTNDTVNDNVNDNENENVNAYANENVNDNDDVSAETPSLPKAAKLVFGEYGNVRLTDSEYRKLTDDFGKKLTEDYIRKVDEYTEQTGKVYKSCYITIRKWIDKDNAQDSADKLISDYEREFFDKIVNQF